MVFKTYQDKDLIFLLPAYLQNRRLKTIYNGSRSLTAVLFYLCRKTDDPKYEKLALEVLRSLMRNPNGVIIKHYAFHKKQELQIASQSKLQRIGGYGFHDRSTVNRYWLLLFQELQKSTVWDEFKDATEIKAKMETAFIARHKLLVATSLLGLGHKYSNMGNIMGQFLRSMAITATYFDYPKALVDAAHFYDATVRIYSTFNGIESESFSYQAQVSGALSRARNSIQKAYSFMLKQRPDMLLSPESIYIQKILKSSANVARGMTYPNGQVVRIGDTWAAPLKNSEFTKNEFPVYNSWGYYPPLQWQKNLCRNATFSY